MTQDKADTKPNPDTPLRRDTSAVLQDVRKDALERPPMTHEKPQAPTTQKKTRTK